MVANVITIILLSLCPLCRDIEILALFVSCMCHDLDHRGTNNSFQVASVRGSTCFCFRGHIMIQSNNDYRNMNERTRAALQRDRNKMKKCSLKIVSSAQNESKLSYVCFIVTSVCGCNCVFVNLTPSYTRGHCDYKHVAMFQSCLTLQHLNTHRHTHTPAAVIKHQRLLFISFS